MFVRMLKRLVQSQASRDQETLRIAQTLVLRGETALAFQEVNTLLARSPASASALFLRGALKRMQKDAQGAVADVERALALGLGEDTAGGYVELAQCWQALGDIPQALSCCEKARALDPESVPAFFLLAQLQLPGDYYFDVLTRVIGHLKPRTYVEIGVFQGASLKLASSAKAIVGIDPDPKITWALEPNMKLFPMTSDAFFASHDLGVELGNRRVDLAFIDGMHQFEFAMRDFANVERYCHPDSVILVHDCYPVDAESAGRDPRDTRWSGDVWRLIVLLKKYRPDLQIHTIGTAPTGLAVIQNLDPQSTYLLDNHDRLVEEFVGLDYSYLQEDKPAKLNLFANHSGQIKAMVRQRGR
jgi:tetratricopeptide (TPR) repeat protein